MKAVLLALIVIVYQGSSAQNDTRANTDQTRLKEILQKTGEYCHRLENAVFDFVCLEEITERIRQSPEFRYDGPMERENSMGIPHLRVYERTKKNRYLYEYRLIGRAEPRITLTSEFGIEKNGIRFPSRLFSEEAYVNRQGKKVKLSETSVVYRDYRFFIVDVDVSRTLIERRYP